MCGLVGILSVDALTPQLQKAFNWMLLFDEVRGQHSTGVLAVTNWGKDNTETQLKKSVGGQASYFKDHGVGVKNDKVHLGSINILMGHNRWATQGAINADNAHPFEFEHVIGAHNGTLPTWQARDLEGGKEFDVDSQALYNHIDKLGVKDLWEKTNGAMALTWYNKTDKTFHFARNADRPLHYLTLDGGKTLVYASEPWMMYIALSRADIKHDDAKVMATGKHYTLSLGDKVLKVREEALPSYKVRPFQSQNHYGQNYSGNSWRGGVYTPPKQGGTSPATKVVEIRTEEAKKETVKRLVITEMTKVYSKEDEVSEAFGMLRDGSLVRVKVGMANRKKAFKTFTNASKAGGHFLTSGVKETVYSANNRYFFVEFDDLEYTTLGPNETLTRIYEGKELVGFEFHREEEKIHSHHSVTFTTQNAWESVVEYGCDNCGCIPTFDKQDSLVWLNSYSFVCEECKNVPFIDLQIKANTGN